MKKSARLSAEDDCIVVEILDPERVEHHGFGTFIWKLQPEELELDESVLEALKPAINRKYSSIGDLFGLEIIDCPKAHNENYRGVHLSYASRASKLKVPLEDVGIDLDFYMLLTRLKEQQ